MRKLLALIFLICGFICNSQIKTTAKLNEIVLAENVILIDSLSADKIYNNSIKWVNKVFKNPDFVLRSKIPGEMFRIRSVWEIPSTGVFGKTTLELYYTMQVDIKDGKVRISISELKGSNNTVYSAFFKSSGERRQTKEVQRYFEDIELYSSIFLKNYIEAVKGVDDNW